MPNIVNDKKPENIVNEYCEIVKEIISNIVNTICDKTDNTDKDFNDDLLNKLSEN